MYLLVFNLLQLNNACPMELVYIENVLIELITTLFKLYLHFLFLTREFHFL